MLIAGALSLAVSLFFGVLVFDSRSRIAKQAVVMWDASKHQTLGVLAEGKGDETATQAAFLSNIGTIAETLRTTASDYEAEFEKMSGRVTKQVGFLLAAVGLVLVTVFVAYWSTDTATVIRRQSGQAPVSVQATVTEGIQRPASVIATTTVTTTTP